MRRLRDKRSKGDARVDPVPVDPDIGLQALAPFEREPLGGFWARRFAELAQQPRPSGELQLGAAVEAANRRVETLPQAGLGRVLGVLEPGAQLFRQPLQGGSKAFEIFGEQQPGFDEAVYGRPCLGLQAMARVGQNGARHDLLADQHQKFFEALMPVRLGDALRPAVSGENPGSGKDIDKCLRAIFVAFDEIADAAPQTPGA